jgi:hypothetical protein
MREPGFPRVAEKLSLDAAVAASAAKSRHRKIRRYRSGKPLRHPKAKSKART